MAVALIIMLLMCVSRHRQLKKKTSLQAITSSNSQGTDVELATLRQLPRGIVHNSNELYIGNCVPSDRELAMLPHMSRDQITLTKFLGSGAFGEVYEGLASKLPNMDEGCVQARVAVKTLRKGASYQEKGEFLKEAQLMGNFQHKHILQLLGICLDNDPNFIIMELMEGGDLLSYLRDHRPRVNLENGLTMADLLSISVDVARGCRYLEEMHFVHRDLACRNCLVSSKDPKERIVKIGDFGLARDIYKNDYYRKEGEGLLPVRWMAPESLVDGVFTSQSDVWAFGVLIWEIISLGQQPYPARSNIEVLHYVRNGGRLKRPVNSTDDMYKLMLKCWSFHPESRPTFKYCLEVLENLKRNVQPTQLVSPHNSQSSTPTRILKPEAGTDTDRRPRDTQVAGTVTGVPRYLELLYDGEDTGYEIPRHQEPPPSYPKEEEVSSLEQLLPNQSTQSNSSHRYSNIIKPTSVP